MRNDYGTISDLAHESGEPIYITKNGEGDIVVMDIDAFQKREELYKLKAKLFAVEELRKSGHTGISLSDSRAILEKIYE